MSYTKEQLLARLKELQIKFSIYEHPVVLTVEAQAKYVGDKGGALSKNLFLKDKKQRFYIVSALPETKVDLKVLSQRLGLGKGGLRMAPEESLRERLKVPLGCVTPFAVLNESASRVALLLDQGFKSKECCFFHPLSNDMSISLPACDLDKFLKSIGREPTYVDLEANPPVGKDNPPDLATFVPSDSIVLADSGDKAAATPGPTENLVIKENKSTAVTAKVVKGSNNVKQAKEKQPTSGQQFSSANSEQFVEEILDKMSAILHSEVTGETIKQHGELLGDVVSNSIKKCLSPELKNLMIIFKNTAYAEGFHAGTHCQAKRCL